MYKLLITLLITAVALYGVALADDDWDGTTDVIHIEDVVVDDAPADSSHAAAGQVLPAGTDLGAYFGAGDNFITGGTNAYAAGEIPPPTPGSNYAAADGSAPAHESYEMLSNEAAGGPGAYGPLWGVPAEAVGLEGYVPETQTPADPNAAPAAPDQAAPAPKADDEAQEEFDQENHKINRQDPDEW